MKVVTFTVAFGIKAIKVAAPSPESAIALAKEQIKAGFSRASQALVDALNKGELTFVVMDADRTKVLAAESSDADGKPTFYPAPVPRCVADKAKAVIPERAYLTTSPLN